jgi:folate-binding protein YgfZ
MSVSEHVAAVGQIDPHQGFQPHSDATGNATLLSQMRVLSIAGSDCERFLQGQLTCDVSKLDGQWQLGACCNAKGRMVANFVIARRDDECRLRLPADQAEALLTHLKKYAVFFKVTLSLLDDIWVVAQWQPQQHQPELANDWQLHWQDRSELWLPQSEALAWLQQQPLCSEQRWHEDDIDVGLVWVTAATREHWIPQNIDWHRHGGVSFNKGCYTGQEIVARLQYLGKAKKGLFRLSTEQAAQFDTLATIQNTEGKAIGELASWRQHSGLGWINLNAVDDSAINIDGTQLSCEAIAYTDEHD